MADTTTGMINEEEGDVSASPTASDIFISLWINKFFRGKQYNSQENSISEAGYTPAQKIDLETQFRRVQ